MSKIATVYLGDINSDIDWLRRAWGHGSKPPVDGNEAAWMRGYSAACNEIETMVRRRPTFTVDPEKSVIAPGETDG